MNLQRSFLLLALAATLIVPFVLRKERPRPGRTDDTLILITPHNDAIRHEFTRGFQKWYRERTGRTVFLDWRVIGGTSEIARYLESEYTSAFRVRWERRKRLDWTAEVQAGYQNPSIKPDDTPGDDTPAEAARRDFLASEVGCGIDLFFGGGSFDFIRQAAAGRLVPSEILQRRPDWFTPEVIPRIVSGEPFWDANGLWFGAVMSSYGILHNKDVLARLGIERPPERWRDLMDPRYLDEVALADPMKSGSIAKAFEMVLQQEIHAVVKRAGVEEERHATLSAQPVESPEGAALRDGWREGLRVLQIIGANARYFTDTSQKPPIDVAQGDSAAGMCIDFYGRYQAEATRRRDDSARLEYLTPPGGSVYSVDPIALFRGAPHREVAEAFIEYTLSFEAQKLWNLKVGAPGGPERFALRRSPVRKDFYTAGLEPWRSDPQVAPFAEKDPLQYQASWTGSLFREMNFILRVMCIDAHPELQEAWREIIAAGHPPEALAALQDLSAVSYDEARTTVRRALSSKNKVDEVRLARVLGETFRTNYRRAAALARRSAESQPRATARELAGGG